ncbi:MAG: TolC family protein [Lewinellaceae bacterium]|nr:TolC family protein [Lewinellaceae bacterium]
MKKNLCICKKQCLLAIVALYWAFTGSAQTIDDYLQLALNNNPGLHAANFESDAAMQRAAQAGVLPDPQANAAFTIPFRRMDMPVNVANVSAMQMFPWKGALPAMKAVADLRVESSRLSATETRNVLAYKVKEAFYPLYVLQYSIRYQQQNKALLESLKNLATSRFQNGLTGMTDVLRVDLMMTDADTEIRLLQEKKTPMEFAFNRLLARPDSLAVLLPDTLLMPARDVVAIGDSSFSSNPKLQLLENKIKIAAAEEKVAAFDQKPEFGAGLALGLMRNPARQMGMGMVMPMFSASIPIRKEKYQAAIQETRIMQMAYGEMKTDMANMLATEYAMTKYEMDRAITEFENNQAQAEKTQQIVRLLLNEYSNGKASMDDILSTQQQLLKYQIAATMTVADYYMAKSKMDYLLSKN